MAVKVAVIYYSATGTTYALARAIEEGAKAAGAEVRFRKVRELAPEEAIKSNEGWAAHSLETQDIEVATNDDAEALLAGARSLLKPSETGGGFGQKYFAAIQREPDVVLAHREVTRILSAGA